MKVLSEEDRTYNREAARRFRAENPTYHRDWMRRNKERLSERAKARLAVMPEKEKARRRSLDAAGAKKHRQRNSPAYQKRTVNWQKSAAGVLSGLRARCKRTGRELAVSLGEFKPWYDSVPRCCVFCDLPEEKCHLLGPKLAQTRLSIDRRDNDRDYFLDNLQLACFVCNMIKSSVFSAEEMREIAQKYIKPKWQALDSDSQVKSVVA